MRSQSPLCPLPWLVNSSRARRLRFKPPLRDFQPYDTLSILSWPLSSEPLFYPGIRPVISFSIHFIPVSSSVLIHLSNQTKNKTKNPLHYQKNKLSSTSPALLYLLYSFFKQNKNKSPFVSQSLSTSFRLCPHAETPHSLVKSYNPPTNCWTQIQSETKNYLSSLFSCLNICSFHIFGLMLINPCIMYRLQ